MKFLLLSDHLSPFFDGWSSDYYGMKIDVAEKYSKFIINYLFYF